jgi:hypothetical protein
MAVTGITNHEQARVEELRRAVHGVHAPFACGGMYVPEQPVAVRFADKTEIPILRAKDSFEQEQLLRPLVDRCVVAGFGKGRKTRYDRAVRDALQLKAEGGAFSVLHFDPAASGILEQVRRELMPQLSEPLNAELYTLNVYASGGHFAPHKDTPRGSHMLGTLVVCLPSQFSNGPFVLKHRGIFQTYDWGQAIKEQREPERIHWAAFFGDVDHQIERVWGGLRVTLTYLLRGGINSGVDTIRDRDRDVSDSLLQRTLRTLLDDRSFLAGGGTLAFPCSHLYHHDARFQRKRQHLSRQTASTLKGRDYQVAAAAIAEKLHVSLCPYLVETCVDTTWQLDHFPTAAQKAGLGKRMDPWDLESMLAIRASAETLEDFDVVWVEPPPNFNGVPTMYPGGTAAADPDVPAVSHLHACEYSATGYFGNEGSEIDLYVYGALHVAIPPYGEGTRARTPKATMSRKGRR